jgi:hypothetical protein
MPTIEERLQALEDERAIAQVMYDYGASVDYGDEALWLDCWAPDAVLQYTFLGRGRSRLPDRRFSGHEEIRDDFRQHTHAPDFFHKHFLVMPQIRLDGDHATASSYFTRLDFSTGEEPFVMAYGRYLDEFRRCPDGRWRFQKRHGEIECLSSNSLFSQPLPDAADVPGRAAR